MTPRVVVSALVAGVLIGTATIAANAGEAPRSGPADSDPPVVDVLMLYSPGALHGAGSEATLRDIAEAFGGRHQRGIRQQRGERLPAVRKLVAVGQAAYLYSLMTPQQPGCDTGGGSRHRIVGI
jgi:hypothetical protein